MLCYDHLLWAVHCAQLPLRGALKLDRLWVRQLRALLGEAPEKE